MPVLLTYQPVFCPSDTDRGQPEIDPSPYEPNGDAALPVPASDVARPAHPLPPPGRGFEAQNAYRFATIVTATEPDPVTTDKKS